MARQSDDNAAGKQDSSKREISKWGYLRAIDATKEQETSKRGEEEDIKEERMSVSRRRLEFNVIPF